MRANLVQREPARAAHWEKLGLYARILQKRTAANPEKSFVLHDGPPFTNGDVHIGTALNKTLKDVINRYQSLRGCRTPYVPGWDCHGLPIEQKVSKEVREEKLTLTTAELRARCDQFSEGWITKQTAQFKRLGVLADWAHEYKTKAPAYEADIIRTFAAFVEQGLVYRSKKPVYWSIPFETALAEAEIEYKEHTSIAIWVKFAVPADEAKKFGLPHDKPLFVVIWTTTPWTLPANLAIALNPDVDYVAWDIGAENIIVAQGLVGSLMGPLKITGTTQLSPRFKGAAIEGLQARHPFIDRAAPVVLADYVTTDSGTGCVHTAPGHGAEDYQTGLKYKLPIYCPVGDDGKYLDDGQVPADMVGLSCLESVEDLEKKRTSAANIAVLKKLAASGALLAKQSLTHSYPHCWRSKTPIIFRAVDQWFVSLDNTGAISSTTNTPSATTRKLAELAIGNVKWIPAWGEARIRGAVESRPDWCVSRQRAWGVPIIAFYDENKTAFLDASVIRAVADKIATRGTNFWFDATIAEILAGIALPAGWPAPAALTCGRDTLDVWIDSGSSYAAVLKRGQGGTHWPADLYLEGSDQHRGWFQSSLWTSVIAYGAAPYKAVLTHGFIVDADRKKISKSSTYEKPQTSDAYIAEHGADVIRLWIASQDFRDDIPISKEILSHVGETYRLLRNTLRFQLSNLFDFEPTHDLVRHAQLHPLDRWALHQTAALINACKDAYENYEFHRVYQLCNQFASVTLSATYHDIIKDRLYTLGAIVDGKYTPACNHPLRRSSQTALHHIFSALVKLLAPILTFTCDEAWSYATAKTEFADDSIHLQDWPVEDEYQQWKNDPLAADFDLLLNARARVTEAIEPLRAAGKLGKSLDAIVTLPGVENLTRHRDFLPELFIVSGVDFGEGPTVSVHHAQELGHTRCPRCWRWVPALETAINSASVCPRCVEALRP